MEKRVNFVLFFIVILSIFFIFIIGSVLASPVEETLHLNIQTTSAGAVVTGTFDFVFNISTSEDCANVIYSNSTSLTTDSRGIISYYLEDVSLNFTDQYWLCYYRDGVLIESSKIAMTPYSFLAKKIEMAYNYTFGMIVGNTSSSYDGDISSGGDIGYVAANAICASEYPDSHFCLEVEVLKTIAAGNYSWAGTGWMAKGAPGYTANADDCSGWTTNSNTYLGPFWNWDANAQAGRGALTNCAQTKPLFCCR